MAWPTNPRPAKALPVLLEQVNEKFPGRTTSSDGMLASEQHHLQNPSSDHEPRNGVVLAMDITHDPKHGFNSYEFADRIRDPRIRYIISNGRITGNAEFIKTNPGYGIKLPWEWGKYTGANDHSEHVHISLVREPQLYDLETRWDVPVLSADDPAAPLVPPLLKRGSTGSDVRDLQRKLGVKIDGDFGPKTEQAVRDFQGAHGLVVDGQVGPSTWKVLTAQASIPTFPTLQDGINGVIGQTVEGSALKNVVWKDRGRAPIGYLKGMAVSFADCLRYPDDYVKEMSKRPGSNDRDALAYYGSIGGDPPGLLRKLFVLMIGLGMRESSGNYNEGRDMSANNVTSGTAEAGLFQQSWDSNTATPLLPKLLKSWPASSDGHIEMFKEGVGTRTTSSFGGGDGLKFQQLCKTKPEFAVYAAGLGLRNIRSHWGPVNRKEVELRSEADDLLKQVQALIK